MIVIGIVVHKCQCERRKCIVLFIKGSVVSLYDRRVVGNKADKIVDDIDKKDGKEDGSAYK